MSQELFPGSSVLEAPAERFDPSGVFWLEPDAINDVDHLINDTRLPTMALGVETQAGDMRTARVELADILVAEEDPLAPELRRALDIGFMYGGLIADKAHGFHGQGARPEQDEPLDMPLPETLRHSLEDVIGGLDPANPQDGHLLFMRLRDVEVAYAGSDILAFSLAATQDHMHRQFAEYHGPEKELSKVDTMRLQSLYYAGALVGALMHSDHSNLGKQPVEILRRMQGPVEPAALRMEFEPDDDLVISVDAALSSKLSLTYTHSREPYVLAEMGGFQFGPNTVSLPLSIPDLEGFQLTKKIPLADVDALIVRQEATEDDQPGKFRLMTDPARYPEVRSSAKIVGMVIEDGELCVGSYHRAHPNARVVHGLAAQAAGVNPGDLPYSSRVEIANHADRGISRKAGYLALGGAMAAPWALDAVAELTNSGQARWEQDALADLLIAVGVALYKIGKWSLRAREQRFNANYQVLLDQITGYR